MATRSWSHPVCSRVLKILNIKPKHERVAVFIPHLEWNYNPSQGFNSFYSVASWRGSKWFPLLLQQASSFLVSNADSTRVQPPNQAYTSLFFFLVWASVEITTRSRLKPCAGEDVISGTSMDSHDSRLWSFNKIKTWAFKKREKIQNVCAERL